MADRYLVVVESPAKAKTIKKILGKGYEVMASYGHLMDLPKSRMGVDVENGFSPEYIKIRGKGEVVSRLLGAYRKASGVILASDPDREGESIAWQVANLLGIDVSSPCRVRMYEITPSGVKSAFSRVEPIDMNKVFAQQARRVLDRLLGYELSPLLWRKVKRGLSAGRVQSVALRMVCEREKEIRDFKPEEYWVIDVVVLSSGGELTLRLSRLNGRPVKISSSEEARRVEEDLRRYPLSVSSLNVGRIYRAAPPPFKTSTLQQEAARRLSFSPRKTMTVAQQLYEGVDVPGLGTVGLITYMRTDSLRVSKEAQEEVLSLIGELFGEAYLPERPNVHHKGGANVQDAHEAIRPTYVRLTPEEVKEHLSPDQFRLYQLIWNRFVASQMAPAVLLKGVLWVEAGPYELKYEGISVEFESFGRLWPLGIGEREMPRLDPGEVLKIKEIRPQQRFTQPPSRYSEAGLIKALEENGVGRPSTYATIVQTLHERRYVVLEEGKLKPTALGELVNELLVSNFPEVVDVQFTARMEEELDQVEEGSKGWVEVVRGFYERFKPLLDRVYREQERVKLEPERLEESCPKCGSPLVIRDGRYGRFVSCSDYPRCDYSRSYQEQVGVPCPVCGAPLVRRRSKRGRSFFGCSRYPECSYVAWRLPRRGEGAFEG